ncbi:MAG: hypothetical protein ABEH78_05670 [Haloferacaceae archaeon]
MLSIRDDVKAKIEDVAEGIHEDLIIRARFELHPAGRFVRPSELLESRIAEREKHRDPVKRQDRPASSHTSAYHRRPATRNTPAQAPTKPSTSRVSLFVVRSNGRRDGSTDDTTRTHQVPVGSLGDVERIE